jgi:predicted acylesterase/phospholipase RssA
MRRPSPNLNSNLPHTRVPPLPRPRPVGLTLQGGGSWGAFTWGALDALLANRSLEIRQLSGTSAGAINAAIVVGSLAKGSPAQARKALRAFWLSVAHPAACDIVRSLWGPLERQWRNSINDLLLTSGIMSPCAKRSRSRPSSLIRESPRFLLRPTARSFRWFPTPPSRSSKRCSCHRGPAPERGGHFCRQP